jgi:GntR family transcriptional regulator / MocR family aminotransferase
VLEDDYDSEYRFSGPPISSLEGLDKDGRVLYMGTFSKVLYPGIKLGYLVVPKPLVAAFKQAHYDLNRPGQMPLQAALAEFIEMGHFSSALRRARQSYAERRQCLLEALAPCWPRPQGRPVHQRRRTGPAPVPAAARRAPTTGPGSNASANKA